MAKGIVHKGSKEHEAAGEVLNKVFKAKALLTSVGKDLEHSDAEDRFYYAIESIVEMLEEACTDISCDLLHDNARAEDVIGESAT